MSTPIRDSSGHTGAAERAPAGTGRPRRRPRTAGAALSRLSLPVFGVVAAVATWQFATWFFEIRPLFLPSPWDVAVALRNHAANLLEEAWVTVFETLAGFAIGAACGLFGAALLAASSKVERATLPLVVGLNAIPKVALAPLLTVWLGLAYAPHIALAALICFFPIMIAGLAGLTSTPTEFAELARSLSASRWQAFVKIQVPWAMPHIFVGLKLGMTLAVIGTVVGQLARPSGGLGTVILLSGQSVNTTLAFAAIVLLMVISIALFYSVVAAERLLVRWSHETTATRI